MGGKLGEKKVPERMTYSKSVVGESQLIPSSRSRFFV